MKRTRHLGFGDMGSSANMPRRILCSKKTETEKDRDWLQRKVAELKSELEKLPVERQEQLRRELDSEVEEQLPEGNRKDQSKKGGRTG